MEERTCICVCVWVNLLACMHLCCLLLCVNVNANVCKRVCFRRFYVRTKSIEKRINSLDIFDRRLAFSTYCRQHIHKTLIDIRANIRKHIELASQGNVCNQELKKRAPAQTQHIKRTVKDFTFFHRHSSSSFFNFGFDVFFF